MIFALGIGKYHRLRIKLCVSASSTDLNYSHRPKPFSNMFTNSSLSPLFLQTPINQASTRSHCIFTVHVCRREPGSAVLRRSKLHLVDLAGSERVSKTGLNGQLLTEAKYINRSLHYLEQVATFEGCGNSKNLFVVNKYILAYNIFNISLIQGIWHN